LHHRQPLGDAAGDSENQRHGHVGGVVGQHAGRVRHQNAALARRGHINVIDPRPVIGDQPHPLARLRQQARVDAVVQRRHQHIGFAQRRGQLVARHWRVVIPQADIEQFAQAGFHHLGQPSRNDNTQTFSWHLSSPTALQFDARHGIVAQERAGHKNPMRK